MRTFLSEVATRLYAKYGSDISSLSVMFSSRRARLFFADALSSIADTPLWEPEYISVDDIMTELSGLKPTDKIRLISELYNIYSRYHEESFDHFYFWGELLVADFDMIDKYMVDASQLFRNISDIKELEADVDYLTEQQLRIIADFWRTVGEEASLSEQKRRFLVVWRTLGTIYNEFRERLRSLGVAYTGMIHREAIERLNRGEVAVSQGRRYVVAGFNALSACERRLFDYMSKNCEVDFFWDYDNYYVDDTAQEAGMFVRRSIAELPSESGISHDNLQHIGSLHTVVCSTNVAQCKYAVTVLRRLAESGRLDKDTAVVLTDENLLMPLLYALPKEFGGVNVTMGYPLRNTSAYSFLERLLELQHHARRSNDGEESFYYADVDGLLAHPYVADADSQNSHKIRAEIVRDRLISVPRHRVALTPLLERIFRVMQGWQPLMEYLRDAIEAVAERRYGADNCLRTEYLSVMSESLGRLSNMLASCGINISDDICRSLIRRHLQGERIPFEGEPLEGLQVMGILETRNLDFRNVLILSMTDDNFPGNRTANSSFIPYGLRFAYGLPTPEHHEGVYAYYFYRLIQRAENVYMFYCSNADKKSMGEPSRYIRQLEYETSFPIERICVGADVNVAANKPIEIRKDERIADALQAFTDGRSSLSPTAFSKYVRCPLMFYFAHIAKIRTDDQLEETVDNQTFGNIFHKAAELLYQKVLNSANPAELLKSFIADGTIDSVVNSAISKVYFRRDDDAVPELNGDLLIIKDIITRYLRDNLLRYDCANGEFVVKATERCVEYDFPIESGGKQIKVHFRGFSDRVDCLKDGTIRIVDYKTGAPHLQFSGIKSIFFGKAADRESNIINIWLYAMMLSDESHKDAVPVLYYVSKMTDDKYSPLLVDKSSKESGVPYSVYADEFKECVATVLSEMFDLSIPFRCADDNETCDNCSFADICAKEEKQ